MCVCGCRTTIDSFCTRGLGWTYGSADVLRERIEARSLPVMLDQYVFPHDRQSNGLLLVAGLAGIDVKCVLDINEAKSEVHLGEMDGSISCLCKGASDLRPLALLDDPLNTKVVCIGQVGATINRFRAYLQ
jgi:hypothetical protein